MVAPSEGTPHSPNPFPSLMSPFHELGLTARSNLPDLRAIRVGIDLPRPDVDDLRSVGSSLDLHAGAIGQHGFGLGILLPSRPSHELRDRFRDQWVLGDQDLDPPGKTVTGLTHGVGSYKPSPEVLLGEDVLACQRQPRSSAVPTSAMWTRGHSFVHHFR